MLPGMEPLKPGDVLARYRLERPLGAGGMGSVWLAVQEGLGRKVALKVMHPAIALDPSLAARFRQEAEVAASFNHPGIVPVTDFGVDDGRPFLVMDFLDGESLDAILTREAPLPAERVAFFAIQVLAALEAMHERNIVHRDLKPDNIFVSASSGVPDIARLLDFGIARVVERDGDAKMTTTGQILGTPTYMSPEQAKGMPVTPSGDLYALGVVMYEALAGCVPFEAENYHQLLFTIVEGSPRKLSELCPDVDGTFLSLVERAMAPKAADRFQNATEMREALAPFAAMDALRGSGAHPKMASPPKSESNTDPLAATMTPQQLTPLAFDATMAPGEEPAPGASGAAPAARSVHPKPEPAAKPWVFLIALLALGGVGAVAYGAMQTDEVTVATGPESLTSTSTERVDEAEEERVEDSPPNEALVDENIEEIEENVEEEPEIEVPAPSDETEAPSAMNEPAAEEPTNNTGAPPNNMQASAMHAASMSPAAHSGGSAQRRIMAPCGSGEHEMFLVRPRDSISFTGINGAFGLSAGVFGTRVRTLEDALTRCFRGKYIRRGQDVHLTLDSNGHVDSVRVREWCPVPAEARSCTQRALSGLDFSDLGPTRTEASFSFDIDGL